MRLLLCPENVSLINQVFSFTLSSLHICYQQLTSSLLKVEVEPHQQALARPADLALDPAPKPPDVLEHQHHQHTNNTTATALHYERIRCPKSLHIATRRCAYRGAAVFCCWRVRLPDPKEHESRSATGAVV
jgi:hypothetical protein